MSSETTVVVAPVQAPYIRPGDVVSSSGVEFRVTRVEHTTMLLTPETRWTRLRRWAADRVFLLWWDVQSLWWDVRERLLRRRG